MADVIKLPPKSEEAELSVLGAILIDNEAVLSVSEFLRPEHFYDSNRAGVYEAMLSLYENRMPIDIVTVSEKLKELKILKKIGGRSTDGGKCRKLWQNYQIIVGKKRADFVGSQNY